MSTPRPLLEVKNLEVTYPGRRSSLFGPRTPFRAVNDVSFSLRRGEAFGIVGESGSGKTTLLRATIGLSRPSGGSIEFEGVDVFALKGARRKDYLRHVHIVFQNPYAAFHPRMTIGEALAEPLAIHGIGNQEERRQKIAECLQLVGLDPGFVARYPHQFSGGQRQRLALARALVLGADVVLADEPVSALDVSIQAQVLNLFQDLKQRLSLTYIIVAHDLAVVRYLCDQVAVMLQGRFVEVGSSGDLYTNPIHPYTKALLAAVPTIKRGVMGEGLAETPLAYEAATGEMTEVEPGHFVALG
jgi:ABC-type glutathione transport system ATPase component